MADLADLQEVLGVKFNDPSLLELAVVHSSYTNENPGAVAGHNERLEFLGDAVLGFVIAEKLYRDFPGLSEGEMTRMRAALVRRDTLAHVARSIGLGDYLYMGRGEEMGGGRRRQTNLAAALEAVTAAVFLDHGLAAAAEFVLRLFAEELAKTGSRGAVADYKSQLQELLQSREQITPTYRVIEAEGPEHNKSFTVEVMAGEKVLGSGTGRSKQSAEKEAARLALKRLADGFTG